MPAIDPMPAIELTTRDGKRLTFAAETGETLLAAAKKADIFLPSACREGVCGACRVTLEAGEVVFGPAADTPLTAAQRAEGWILPCVACAQGDLELKAPYDYGAIGFMPISERKATIVELSPAGTGAVRLLLRLENDLALGQAAKFHPGQFMELTVPGTRVSRAYSLANTPNPEGFLEFLIRLQPNGVFSGYLTRSAKAGDVIAVRGPQGGFRIDASSPAPRWFVAGGTGLAPILSMLRKMAEAGERRAPRLFFGVNKEEELFAQEAIESLQQALPQLVITICVWRPESDWRGFSGTPADALAKALAAGAETPDLYVCGPPGLATAVEAAARAAGVALERIFTEPFTPA